jgi:hypothetical protein
MLPQHSLDFAQLDTESTQLDLVITSSEIFKTPVSKVTNEIARLVETTSSEWIRNESRGRHFRSIQVATRETFATEIQLARHTDGHRMKILVEHIRLRV